MKLQFRASDADQGKRLDIFLHERASGAGLSRTAIRRIIDLGGVHIDGNRQRKCGLAIRSRMNIALHADNQPLEPFRLSADHILFQDDYLIAINKPPGVETQPTPARFKGCLHEALLVWLGRAGKTGNNAAIGMIQRLDRDTSGVIVFSIHKKAHKPLGDQFQARTVRKKYLALVAGIMEPASGELLSNLIKDQRTGMMRAVHHGGREAITSYETIATHGDAASLVDIEIKTGRTHQIRVQFAATGHPLAGDTRYGGPATLGGQSFPRQCLHSHELLLRHPVNGTELHLRAPIPADMMFDGSQASR